MRKIETNANHEQFRLELLKVYDLRSAKGDIPPIEMLAIAAHLVGQMIALQDQTKYNVKDVMDLVSWNIEQGNRMVIERLMKSEGNG